MAIAFCLRLYLHYLHYLAPNEPQSSVEPTRVGLESTREPDLGTVKGECRVSLVVERGAGSTGHSSQYHSPASEVALNDLCWIPFGVKIQSAGPEGRILSIAGPTGEGGRGIHVEVPPGAVCLAETVEVHSAVILNGPFTLPEGYQFGSHVVYIYYDGRRVNRPLCLRLPHWYGGEDQVRDGLSFAMAPHTLKEGESVYHFELLEGGRMLSGHCGELEIDGHCSLFAKVFKKGAVSRYQAMSLQKEERNETTCDVAVMYASPLWHEASVPGHCHILHAMHIIALDSLFCAMLQILMKHRKVKSGPWTVSNPSCPFTFKENRIKGWIKEEHGNGWHAAIDGSHEVSYNNYCIIVQITLCENVIFFHNCSDLFLAIATVRTSPLGI